MPDKPPLVPLLVVREASRAVEFYVTALGAEVRVRFAHGEPQKLSHADLTLNGALFSVTEEAPAWNSEAPPTLGGSPVVLQLATADVDSLVERVTAAGATLVFPLQEFCGERMARVRDPFGHLWILSQRLEELSVEEIQRRRDALFARFAQRT